MDLILDEGSDEITLPFVGEDQEADIWDDDIIAKAFDNDDKSPFDEIHCFTADLDLPMLSDESLSAKAGYSTKEENVQNDLQQDCKEQKTAFYLPLELDANMLRLLEPTPLPENQQPLFLNRVSTSGMATVQQPNPSLTFVQPQFGNTQSASCSGATTQHVPATSAKIHLIHPLVHQQQPLGTLYNNISSLPSPTPSLRATNSSRTASGSFSHVQQRQQQLLMEMSAKTTAETTTSPTPPLRPVISSSSLELRCNARHNPSWDKSYQQLCEFYQVHGHCQVPLNDTQYPRLARWIKRQRFWYKKFHSKTAKTKGKRESQITSHRIALLDRIGFVWDPHGRAWEENFSAYCQYVERHGHEPPLRLSRSRNEPSSSFASLVTWIQRTRKQYAKWQRGEALLVLTKERIGRLQAVGFRWNNTSNVKSCTPLGRDSQSSTEAEQELLLLPDNSSCSSCSSTVEEEGSTSEEDEDEHGDDDTVSRDLLLLSKLDE